MIIRCSDFDISESIDFVTPIKNLDGKKKLFHSMLSRLEDMSLNGSLVQITDGLNQKDWLKMKSGAHQLKGASGYVGAG